MSTLMTRIRSIFRSNGNGKTPVSDIPSDESREYERQHRTLLVGRGIICWWSGMPPAIDARGKANGRAPID